MAVTRWGIVGSGRICSDFVSALSLLPKNDHQVVGVGSRTLSSAETFAKRFNIPKAHGSYKDLADDPHIDVVYVGTITATHFDVCKTMINAGKNVLCEKPVTMNATDAKAILQLAKKKNLFFMEGFWSRFFPAYHKLREVLTTDIIGEVKAVTGTFGMKMIERIDVKDRKDSITLSLGSYGIQFAQLVFKEYPEKIVASGMLTANGVDECCSATLHYSNRRMAQFFFHGDVSLPNIAYVHGTKGSIEIPQFWCPLSMTVAGERLEFPLDVPKSSINCPRTEGFIYQAEAIRQSLLKGEKENPLMTHEESIQNMSILTEILNQIGVAYDV